MKEDGLWMAIKALNKAKRTKCHPKIIEKLEKNVQKEALIARDVLAKGIGLTERNSI